MSGTGYRHQIKVDAKTYDAMVEIMQRLDRAMDRHRSDQKTFRILNQVLYGSSFGPTPRSAPRNGMILLDSLERSKGKFKHE